MNSCPLSAALNSDGETRLQDVKRLAVKLQSMNGTAQRQKAKAFPSASRRSTRCASAVSYPTKHMIGICPSMGAKMTKKSMRARDKKLLEYLKSDEFRKEALRA